MANETTTLTAIDVFGQEILFRLKSLLGFVKQFPRNMNVGEYASHGQTLYIPSVAISGGLSERGIGGAAVASDVASSQVAVTMAQHYKGVKVDNLVNTLTNVDLMTRLADDLAGIAAEGIDAILYRLWKQIPNQVGNVDGTSPFAANGLNILADARLVATRNKWPKAAPRYGILTPAEATELLKVPGVIQVQNAGSAEALREGKLGRVMGWDLDESNTTDEVVTLATATNWGAAPVVNGAHAIGATTIAVSAAGTGTIPAGSIFSVGGNAYTAKADATITTNAATITLNVPLKTAVAGGAAITPVNHSAASGIGLLYNPNAFLFVNRPMAPFMAGTGVLEKVVTDPDSGLTFRLLFESQGQGGAGDAYSQKVTLDILCGAAVIRPEQALRFAGK